MISSPFPWNPTSRQLRLFGLSLVAVLPLVAGYWSKGAATVVLSAAAAGAVVALVGLLYPRSIRPLFLGMSLAAWPIGIVVHELCLGLIFCGVFVPLGVVLRLLGRDPLQRTLEADAATYWQARVQTEDPARYYRRW